MKKAYLSVFIILALAVFVGCFLIGRATALKDSKEKSIDREIYTGTISIPKKEENVKEADAKSYNVKKQEKTSYESADEPGNTDEEDKPAERMLFPCGKVVLKNYSQTAVYSKTMGDWRAHTGIDFKAEKGDKVISVWNGTVTKVYKDNLWGYTVEISHSGDILSVYKNLDENISVKKGDKVKKGQVIGYVGNSAAVESREEPHLHFELWTGGQTINPESYVY